MGRTQDGHLTIRCTAEQAERIRKAAAKAEASLTEFLLGSALRECDQVEAGRSTTIFKLQGMAKALSRG